MKLHCKGVQKLYPLQTAGGIQEFRILQESDVLRLIIGSGLSEAQEFERKVFEEILPTIRKTGELASGCQRCQSCQPDFIRTATPISALSGTPANSSPAFPMNSTPSASSVR